jgi:hypothetical protein
MGLWGAAVRWLSMLAVLDGLHGRGSFVFWFLLRHLQGSDSISQCQQGIEKNLVTTRNFLYSRWRLWWLSER